MRVNQVDQIPGVRISQTYFFSDTRGQFIKLHPLGELGGHLDSIAISINPTAGTVRGLHFQIEPYAEEKVVTCIKGAIFDVVVDLRKGSETFGKWAAFELNSTNLRRAFLPKGIAHGFQTLAPDTIVHYALSAPYTPASSFSIDPFGDINIGWPLKTKLISEKDAVGISLSFAAQVYARSIES